MGKRKRLAMHEDDEEHEEVYPIHVYEKPGDDSSKALEDSELEEAADLDAHMDNLEDEKESWGRDYHIQKVKRLKHHLDAGKKDARVRDAEEARRIAAHDRSLLSSEDFFPPDYERGSHGTLEDNTMAFDGMAISPKSNPSQEMRPSLGISRIYNNSPISLAFVKELMNDIEVADDLIETVTAGPVDGESHLHLQVLHTYLANIAFYISLELDQNVDPSTREVLRNKVFRRLLQYRQVLSCIDDSPYKGGMDYGDDNLLASDVLDTRHVMEELENDAPPEVELLTSQNQTATTVPASIEHVEPHEDPRKSTRRSRKRQRRNKPTRDENVAPENWQLSSPQLPLPSDVVDILPATSGEPGGQQGKRHSLRFHTSRIENKTGAQDGLRKTARNGDEDIPLKASKEARRKNELQKQRHGLAPDDDQNDADIGETESDGFDLADESYYSLVKKDSSDRTMKALPREVARIPEEASSNGPREVNRAIMANKGLTPKRNKANRNPRVKKRMRFDKAQKKVASMKPTFKGGEGALPAQGYQGESTGINRRVIKSSRLSK